MAENMKAVLDEFMGALGELKKTHPEYVKLFVDLVHGIEGEGKLSTKVKELISVALAVNARCKYCIAFHTNNALKAGATKEEIIEAGFVGALMGGGPALTYLTLLIKALEDLK